MYLDSHRNIVQSLNVIGHHLAEHSNDAERAAQIKKRLSATNSRWDRVCFACTEWQTKLQTALMEVSIATIYLNLSSKRYIRGMPIIRKHCSIKTIKKHKNPYEYFVNLVLFKNIIHIRGLLKGVGHSKNIFVLTYNYNYCIS